MTKKTLEDKVKDAQDAFGNEFTPQIEALGYFLTYGISKIGLRDPDAPKKDKNKPCFMAYITPNEQSPLLEDHGTLVHIARDIIPDEYKGFRVFLEYSKAFKPRDDLGPKPKPAYGVPFPSE